MRKKCLVLIKPDGISRGLLPTILQKIEEAGLVVIEKKFITATPEQCRKHHNIKIRSYGATEEQIVDYLARSYIKNENICVMILKGENAVERALEVKMKIREMYCTDNKEKCKKEGRALHNIMHSSESVEDTEKEIDVWLN